MTAGTDTFDPGQPVVGAVGTTLVAGSNFCISTDTGNIVPGAPMGLFVRDTRVLSEWVLEVDGDRVESLSVLSEDPFRAVFVTRSRPRAGQIESTLLLLRDREVADGMVETLRLRNLSGEAAAVSLVLHVGSDFADLFDVKLGRGGGRGAVHVRADAGMLELRQERGEGNPSVRVLPEGAGLANTRLRIHPGRVTWDVVVPARQEWTAGIRVQAFAEDGVGSAAPQQETTTQAQTRLSQWRESAPRLTTPDQQLRHTLTRSLEDLGALRIFDPAHPKRAVVAAGAPWFMALFGRDSLLSSWMALPLDPGLALGTVQALAELQGRREDPFTEEQPGRILHERRYGRWLDAEGGDAGVYYGSIDSTPLFVMLVGELRRWGVAAPEVDALMPAVDRALHWITDFGDRDGDAFVEYQRFTDRGIRNQGWKDSYDGVTFADGRIAEPPIALCEVQGYTYAAYLARAHFARETGDEATAQQWISRAEALKRAFNEQFWLPDREWFAVGLDRDKKPIDALASNMGHCLWTGIVDEDKAPAVAAALTGPELFSGWGVRTLGTTMGAYNPMGYHNGSVWPHDNAIVVAGLMRYGFTAEATRVAEAVFDAAPHFGGRLPELFCGFSRHEFPRPVPYPTSCSPQAWAAAAPILLLRALLRFDPWVPFGDVHLAPVLPERLLPLRLEHVLLGGRRVDITVTHQAATVDGLDGVTVVRTPRPTATSLTSAPTA